MRLAILPRMIDTNEGKENAAPYFRYVVNKDFEVLAKKYGFGLCTIMPPYEWQEICDLCDGLIIPGSGTKVNPSYYGQEPMDPPPEYDEYAFDSAVMDYFVKQNKPVLGICAGHQAINIYFGGTIEYITNDGTRPHYTGPHPVNIKPGSFVYDALKTERTEINSFHVMYTDVIGEGLEVVAISDDGIVEAVQHKEKKVFGVQWHPEKNCYIENSPEMKIFENFIECCKK